GFAMQGYICTAQNMSRSMLQCSINLGRGGARAEDLSVGGGVLGFPQAAASKAPPNAPESGRIEPGGICKKVGRWGAGGRGVGRAMGLSIACGRRWRGGVSVLLAILWAIFLSNAAAADTRSNGALLVLDANSGRILQESAPDAPRHPASLAKLMLLYLTF